MVVVIMMIENPKITIRQILLDTLDISAMAVDTILFLLRQKHKNLSSQGILIFLVKISRRRSGRLWKMLELPKKNYEPIYRSIASITT